MRFGENTEVTPDLSGYRKLEIHMDDYGVYRPSETVHIRSAQYRPGHIMPRMRHSNLVVVQSFGTQAQADIALGVLESSGIEAITQADTAGGMRQDLAWSGLG